MPIEHIPDWEDRLNRQDAFWDREVIGRAVVHCTVPKSMPEHPVPATKGWGSEADRWLDSEYQAELAHAEIMNTHYLGDALPRAYPNLGPEVFSAFFGCRLEFGRDTAWSVPNLNDWSDADSIRFSKDNFYWRKVDELTDALLERGKGKFYTGITDLHPGADAIAAFRDPQMMSLDMVENPEHIRRLLRVVTDIYFEVYDYYFGKLRAAGQAISSWPPIVSSRKWYVPSNDFSCMISSRMFDEFFLPGIAEECRHTEASIYHLDGPDALRHLDSLLGIPELNAIQWVYGAGNGRASDWLPVYKKCQAAGKGLQLALYPDELELFIEELRPEGLWISLHGVRNADEAEALIARIAKW